MADAAVEEALGAAPEEASAYGNGDQARLAPGIRDRAHEYGCSWTADGTTAAAWVYAPPVSRVVATELLRQARAVKGCEPVTAAPAYGEPSAGLVCTSTRGREVTFRGLFGDAWLVCSLRQRVFPQVRALIARSTAPVAGASPRPGPPALRTPKVKASRLGPHGPRDAPSFAECDPLAV